MGERKVLNKYFPPDFDPAALPKRKRADTNDMKVRMMLPMTVRCRTCGTFMYKGTKFNTRKEDVMGDTYLGIQIFRFYYRCRNCAAEFTMKTDPKTSDYILEEGATRNYEHWREEEKAKVETAAEREQEEMGNAMKALENRTLESKREMDVMAALDEMRGLRSKQAKISTEDALAALQREADRLAEAEGAGRAAVLKEDFTEDLAEFYRAKRAAASKQLQGSSSDSESDAEAEDPSFWLNGGVRRGDRGGGQAGGARQGGSTAARRTAGAGRSLAAAAMDDEDSGGDGAGRDGGAAWGAGAAGGGGDGASGGPQGNGAVGASGERTGRAGTAVGTKPGGAAGDPLASALAGVRGKDGDGAGGGNGARPGEVQGGANGPLKVPAPVAVRPVVKVVRRPKPTETDGAAAGMQGLGIDYQGGDEEEGGSGGLGGLLGGYGSSGEASQ